MTNPLFLPAKDAIRKHAEDGVHLRKSFFAKEETNILATGLAMAQCFANGNKILLCGNGGSAADAQHIAAEFVNRFVMERPPLPAIALTTDSSILTSIGNDYCFDQAFSKQILALGSTGDILIAISTSGTSPNITKALQAAKEKNMICIAFTGKGGGIMPEYCQYVFDVVATNTALIQEIHITLGHMLCHLTDHFLFENVKALTTPLE